MNEIIEYVYEFLVNNCNSIFNGLIVSGICFFVGIVLEIIKRVPQDFKELLHNADSNDPKWKENIDKILQIQQTMKRNFPEYNSYLLIQYGSSVTPTSILPNDYDFIVLMLGYPENEERYIYNKGTIQNVSGQTSSYQVDIVFRDYLSFLYAASCGMPYENSVIVGGKLIKGYGGYFQWLKNITKNNLFDRDFLIRRYEDKIINEKQEFLRCISKYEKKECNEYYVVRAGYYYITSLLQFNRMKKSGKMILQSEIVKLSKPDIFYGDFEKDEIKAKYIQLVENLKRNKEVDLIGIEDLKEILECVEEENNERNN